MTNNIHTMIDGMRDEMTETLCRWLVIPSEKAEAAEGAPFGEAVARALDAALDDAEKMGFSIRNFDHYAGDARIGALGVDPLAVLVHLDVVPAGDGWHTDPYAAVMKDGRIYGRGTTDDKGPAVAALYALYALQKAGIPLRREVRLIFGCDEESGWEDIAYYKKHCDMPKTGFSPDASFPLINTEKGMLQMDLRGTAAKEGLQVVNIRAGDRRNVIPGFCTALVCGDAALCEKIAVLAKDMNLRVEAAMEGETTVRISSTGINGHSAYPENAKNAIGQLLLMLRALGVEGMLKTLADTVGMEYNGESLGVQCCDKTSGALTCNIGILQYDESGCYATLDIRYPLLANHESLMATVGAALGENIEVKLLTHKKPHHVPPSNALVTALLDAYHEETGRKRECLSTGGGTYARSLEEGVAFGSAFPEDEELAHQANEYIAVDALIQNAYIFANAIQKLAGGDAV